MKKEIKVKVAKKDDELEKIKLAKRLKQEEMKVVFKKAILQDVKGYMSLELYRKFEREMASDLVDNLVIKI